MHLAELKSKPPSDLLAFAESLQIENASSLRKQDIMFAIFQDLTDDMRIGQMGARHTDHIDFAGSHGEPRGCHILNARSMKDREFCCRANFTRRLQMRR